MPLLSLWSQLISENQKASFIVGLVFTSQLAANGNPGVLTNVIKFVEQSDDPFTHSLSYSLKVLSILL